MLESLKRWASGWVAFVMIALLILSFAIWGIADYITGGGGGRALATIGDKQVTAEEFRRAFGNEINTLSRQAGQRITYDQARAVGLDTRVLSQLIGSTAVEAHAEEMNLALSDRAIAEGFKSDPAFQNAGRFDRDMVSRLQRELGVSERGLIELRRKDELRNQVTTALLRATVVPDEMVSALNDWRGETRVISHFTIDPAKLEAPADPTEDELKKYYEDNKSRYMTAPRRDLEVLHVSIGDLEKKADLSEEQIKKAFDQTKSRFAVAEKRRIEQIAFKDKAAAAQALADIKSGKDFLEVAKENGAAESDVKLGMKEKSDLIDAKIAEAAFKLAKDELSDVIEGSFTTVLLRVTEIEAGKEAVYEEVKDQVRALLATEWAQNHLRDYYGRVDDGRGEGRPLKEIATELDLPFFDLKGTTRGNVTADNKPALTVPDANAIINAGFRADIGVESEPIQLADGGYAWVDVTATEKAQQQSFEDVADLIKTAVKADRQRTLVSDAAAKFAERLKAGEDFAKIAEEAGGNVETTAAVGRTTIPDGLTQSAMTQAFALRTGEIGNAETADGKSRTLLKVDEIKPAPAPSVELTAQLDNELTQQVRTDLLAAYVEALQKRFGVEINQAAFRYATGADQQNQY